MPHIRKWLLHRQSRPAEFIEPFVGGGIISLTVAAERLADHVIMVELDAQVAAVWQTILTHEGAEWLAEKIVTFNLTPDSVQDMLAMPVTTMHERAFQTILKNRVNRGGILAHGAGLVKHGEQGKGLKSRWYPQTLKNRILEIARLRDQITFICGDGMEIIARNADRKDSTFFVDPPYTAAGKKAGARLYSHSELNHPELFRTVGTLAGDFLMTYDDSEEVRTLANYYGYDWQPVAMKNTHHAEMTELLIGRDLDWNRGCAI